MKTQEKGLRCTQRAPLSLEASQLRYIPENWASTAHPNPVFHYRMCTVKHLNESTLEPVALGVRKCSFTGNGWSFSESEL